MDLSGNDLEEYVEKLENVFSNQKSNIKSRNELYLLLETVFRELNVCRKSEDAVRDNMQKLLDSSDFDVNTKYVQVKEVCGKQESEITILKSKMEQLNKHMKVDLESQKNEYLNKVQHIEDKYHLEITNLKNQIESNRKCHEMKERELYNDLQMTQAASAVEYDVKESNFKKQLEEAACKLRLSQSKVRSMQCEIGQMRTQLSLLKLPPNDNTLYYQENPIQQIKNRLAQKQYQQYNDRENVECGDNQPYRPHSNMSTMSTENENNYPENLNVANNTLQLRSSHNANDLVRSSSTSSLSTYEADNSKLNQFSNARSRNDSTCRLLVNNYQHVRSSNSNQKVHSTQDPNDENIGDFPQIDQIYSPAIYKGKFAGSRAKNNIPPLKSCSNSKGTPKQAQRKKRKLYDPDNVDLIN